MLIHQRLQNIMQAKRTKALVRGTGKVAGNCQPRFTHHPEENVHSWYQKRKRASQRLRALSPGRIVLIEDGYRGDHRRHWLRNSLCEHIFRASLKEVSVVDAEAICPFCHFPDDLGRFGKLEALQEHVYRRSHGNIAFTEDNTLGSSYDLNEFACLIQGFRFNASYREFDRNPERFCYLCNQKEKEKSDNT